MVTYFQNHQKHQVKMKLENVFVKHYAPKNMLALKESTYDFYL